MPSYLFCAQSIESCCVTDHQPQGFWAKSQLPENIMPNANKITVIFFMWLSFNL